VSEPLVFSGTVVFGTYDALIFVQHLIVLAQTDQKHQSGDVLKTVNPFLPLRPLTTDVKQLVCEFADLESRLGDTSGLDTRPKDILIGGGVTRR